MAELLEKGAKVAVVGVSIQRNFCIQTAATTGKVSMKAILILMRDPDAERQGNLLLDDPVGAGIRLTPLDTWNELHRIIGEVTEDLKKKGVEAQAPSGFEPIASMGHMNGVLEMLTKVKARIEGLGPMFDLAFTMRRRSTITAPSSSTAI